MLSKQDNGVNPVELLSGNELVLISNEDGTKLYKTNFKRLGMLMDDYEQQMINMFFKNHNEEYVLKYGDFFAKTLTTQNLKQEFLAGLNELKDIYQKYNKVNQSNEGVSR